MADSNDTVLGQYSQAMPKKKKKIPDAQTSGPGGAAASSMLDARDPMVYVGGTDDEGRHFGYGDRASKMNIDLASVSHGPLASSSMKAAASAAQGRDDRTMDQKAKVARKKKQNYISSLYDDK